MTNIDYFKQDISVGDIASIELTSGKTVQGEIIEISDFVIIKKEDGKVMRLLDGIIGGWELIKHLEEDTSNGSEFAVDNVSEEMKSSNNNDIEEDDVDEIENKEDSEDVSDLIDPNQKHALDQTDIDNSKEEVKRLFNALLSKYYDSIDEFTPTNAVITDVKGTVIFATINNTNRVRFTHSSIIGYSAIRDNLVGSKIFCPHIPADSSKVGKGKRALAKMTFGQLSDSFDLALESDQYTQIKRVIKVLKNLPRKDLHAPELTRISKAILKYHTIRSIVLCGESIPEHIKPELYSYIYEYTMNNSGADPDNTLLRLNVLSKFGLKVSKAYLQYVEKTVIPELTFDNQSNVSVEKQVNEIEDSNDYESNELEFVPLTSEDIATMKMECLQDYMAMIKSSSLKPSTTVHTNAQFIGGDEDDTIFGIAETSTGEQVKVNKYGFVGDPSIHLKPGAPVFSKKRPETGDSIATIGLMSYNAMNQYFAVSVKNETYIEALSILKYLIHNESELDNQKDVIRKLITKLKQLIRSEKPQAVTSVPVDARKTFLTKELLDIFSSVSIDMEALIPTNASLSNEGLGHGVKATSDDGSILDVQGDFFIGSPTSLLKNGLRVYTRPQPSGMCYITIEEMSYSSLLAYCQDAIENSKYQDLVNIIKALRTIDSFTSVDERLRDLYNEAKNGIKKDVRKNIKLLQDLSEDEKSRVTAFIKKIIEKEDHNSPVTDFQIISAYNSQFNVLLHTSVIQTIRKDLNLGNDDERKFESSDTIIEANCFIDKYFIWYNNGAAHSPEYPEIRFKDEIVDPVLLESLKLYRKGDSPIPAICGVAKEGRYLVAKFMVQPGSVSSIFKTAQFFENAGNKQVSDAIMAFLQRTVKHELSNDNLSFSSLYTRARELRRVHEYGKAEELLLSLIAEQYQLDTVVKDLSDMYREMGDTPKAIKLMEKYIDTLESKQKAYNFMSNLYTASGMYKESIGYLKKGYELIDPTQKSQRTNTLFNIANQYILAGDTDSAKETLEQAKRIDNNLKVSKLLEKLSSEKKSDITKITKVLSFKAPAFLDADIRTNNMHNLSEEASKAIIKARGYIGQQGQEESSKTTILHYAKVRYTDLLNGDRVSSAQDYMISAQKVNLGVGPAGLLLLLTQIITDPIELSSIKLPANFEDFLKNFTPDTKCERVLYLFLSCLSQETAPSVMNYLYENKVWNDFICSLLGNTPLDKTTFRNVLKKKVEEFCKVIDALKSILVDVKQIDNSYEMSNRMVDIASKDYSKYLSSADNQLLFELNEILQNIHNIQSIDDFHVAEDRTSLSRKKIGDIKSKIYEAPTELSLLYLCPILEKCEYILSEHLFLLGKEKAPVISIIAVSNARINNDIASLQLKISNKEGHSKMMSASVKIIGINGRDVSEKNLLHNIRTPLYGGDNTTFEMCVPVSNDDLISKILTVNLQVTYMDKDSQYQTIPIVVDARIDDSKDFKPFVNEFIKFANGQEVKDYNMVKGREKDIQTIVDRAVNDTTGTIIYGQRRSGKSTILYHVWDRICKSKNCFAVKMSMLPLSGEDNPIENEESFLGDLYFSILSEIQQQIKKENRQVYKDIFGYGLDCNDFIDNPNAKFKYYLNRIKDVIVEKLGYANDRIILIIDEFTSLYAELMAGNISGSFIGQMKTLSEEGSITFILSGHDVMPRFYEDYPNEFGIYPKLPVTSINEISARELVEMPVWDKEKNQSRYEEYAVNRIVEMSGYNPFFIQIICAEVIEYANRNKISIITEYDVNRVINAMASSEAKLRRGDFDNLIPVGDNKLFHERVFGVSLDDVYNIAKEIAQSSQDYVSINSLYSISKQNKSKVLDYLISRDVLDKHPEYGREFVKIKVGIFKEWLRKNEQ